MDFVKFAKSVRNTIAQMTKGETKIFRSSLSGDKLWEAYLVSFPPGTDIVFPGRKRTHHDCSCCRSFIKNVGTMVSLKEDGTIKTIWDARTGDPTYDIVAQALADLVRSSHIENVFLTTQTHWGVEKNYEIKPHLESPITWDHFSAVLPAKLVVRPADLGTQLGNYATTHQVFSRGLQEMRLESLETVLDLIKSNSIYRGAEHRNSVESFLSLKRKFAIGNNPNFVWQNINHSNARFRNSVIGTLVQDLDEGFDVEDAVARFESKVAPQNYRRSSAPITQGMVDKALEKVRDLGLEPSLSRRFAQIGDVSIKDVIWASGKVSSLMKDHLRDLLTSQIKPAAGKTLQGTEISVEEFFDSVVPNATDISLHFERAHLSNLVTLTTAVHEDSPSLFFWGNTFSWSYKGGVTDSIKERVKAAGGKIDCKLRVSLSWFNYDDLDIHCMSPVGRIYYANRQGILDVDMNAGSGKSRTPVENMAFSHLRDGNYTFYVNQFEAREKIDVGFEIEYEHGNQIVNLTYPHALRNGQNVECLSFNVTKSVVTNVLIPKNMSQSSRSTTSWGLTTGTSIPVDTVMLSPNYWESSTSQKGNKHYIFALRGAKCDEPARGFFNEFLHGDLTPHRKVLEVLGDKLKCEPTQDQISGVGFSSTRQDIATFTVQGRDGSRKTYTVKF